MTFELCTERLILKQPTPADADPFIALMADPAVAATLTLDGKPQDTREAWRGFAALLGHWDIRGYGMFSVFRRDTGDWIGRIGPYFPGGWPGLEIGWSLTSPNWGHGFAVEAAARSAAWIFDREPSLERVISLIEPRNTASQRVAQRLGETKTGETFKIGPLEVDVWRAARTDFFNQYNG
ncbi:MAG: GNAT family N-acetyltransferase [Pseudomonadota bacterium]